MTTPRIQTCAVRVAFGISRLISGVLWVNRVILALALLTLPAPVSAQGAPQILIVNSYHKGYPWSDQIVAEIEASLDRYIPDATLDVEYMDTKSQGFDPEYQDILLNLFRYKFADRRFDLIITTDDNALEFVNAHHAEVFFNAPVIFTGVNDASVEQKITRALITGILSVDAGRDSIDAILKMLPDTKRLLLIYDSSETGNYLYDLISESFQHFPGITFERIDSSYTMAEAQQRLARGEPRTAAILGMFFHDKNDQYFDIAVGTSMLSEASTIPIFAIHGQVFEHGTLGGKLLYGRQFGKKALELAAGILSGTSPGDIPLVNETLAEYIYDARQLARFDIDLQNLPTSASVINEPQSLFNKYKRVLILMSVAGVVLIAVIAYLLYVNTKRQRAQNLFELLFNTINIGIFQVSREGKIMLVNDTAGKHLHFEKSPEGFIDFQEWAAHQSLFYEDGTSVRHEDRPVRRALVNAEVVTDELYKVHFPERDEVRWYRISATPQVNQSANRLEYVLCSFYDVTEQIDSEQKLRRSEKMEALGNIIAGIAHDFNNALAIVRGNLDTLQLSRRGDGTMGSDIKACNDAVTRCVRLTERLLAFARQRDEQQSGSIFKTIELNSYLSESQGFLRKSLTPEIDLELDLHPGPLHIKVDPEDLENALINLAINARDAMNGKGHLKIQTHIPKATPDGEPGIEIVVSDTGSGISQKDIERIFEPFYSTKDKNKGTGLGLSMVYGFIKRSGGRITAVSEPDEGTQFHITLPRVSPDCSAGSDNKPDEHIYHGAETVLVVDDEGGLLDTTCRLLRALGYQTVAAENYDVGAHLLTDLPRVDLVISDVLLGGQYNGIDFARYVHERHPDVPIILMSGQMPFYADKIAIGDKLDVIEKPFSVSTLSQKIRKILDESRQETAESV